MFHLDFFRFQVILNFSQIPIGVRLGSNSVLVCLMTLLFDCTSSFISLGLRFQ